MQNRSLLAAALLTSLVTVSGLVAETAPVAQFLADDSILDEFPGGGGQGWQDGWEMMYPKVYAQQYAVEVSEADPLPGFARRLEIRSIMPGKNADTLLGRVLDREALGATQPYTIAFKARMDSVDPAGEAFSFSFIGQREGGGWGLEDSVWALSTQRGFWNVVGGNENGDGLAWKRLPIAVNVGVVYSFLIHVDPVNRTYRVEISDGIDAAESPEMRSALPANSTNEADKLLFRAASAAGSFVWSLTGLEVRTSK